MNALIFLIIFSSIHLFIMPEETTFEKRFPPNPLEGTFVVTQTIPDIDSVPLERTDATYFFPNQRIRFEYLGEVGSDWPGYYEYRMTLLPPLDPRMCRHPQWYYLCIDEMKSDIEKILKNPVKRDMVLEYEIIGEDKDIEYYQFGFFGAYGLKNGNYVYYLMFADKSGTHDLFFKDWDTLVSHTYYSAPNLDPERKPSASKYKYHSVIQILKRVKE